MDTHELVDRGRQAIFKRADSTLSRLGYDFAPKLVETSDANRGRFFFEPESVNDRLSLLRERFPHQAELIVQQADKALRHEFDLLGYEDLNYGNPIAWHADLVNGKTAPKKAFYKIRYLDFDQVGDSKVVWELNRHQHLVTLAKAYRLTDDARYADEIFRQWRHWHAENPYPIGINWVSSLEVAFRSLSWHWTYQLLAETPGLTRGFRSEWLRAQALNGRHIERYLSTYFSPNTHLLGEAVALLFLGTLCPELGRARHWKSLGWEIVLNEARRQVCPDGFHFERSTYYHVYALDFLLHATIAASLNDLTTPNEFEKALEAMLHALMLLGRTGSPPSLGDDDGGRVFDPRRNRSEHMLDPLATGAVLSHRPDFKSVAGDLREETIWLLGRAGLEEWDAIPLQPAAAVSASLPSAGLCLLVSTDPPSQLVISAGSGARHSQAHRHADALSVSLHSQGHALLVDPGTFTYVGDNSERDSFRSIAMHNTLRVDGMSQGEPGGGPFAWKQTPGAAKVDHWITGETFTLFVGSHDAHSRLSSPAVHRRWVLALKSGLFLIRDAACGSGKHRLDISWRFGPEMQMHGEHLFRVKADLVGLAIICPEKHGWSESVQKDVWSPVYGKKQSVTVLNFGTTTALPAEFVTVIVPLKEVGGIPGKLERSTALGSTVQTYRYTSRSGEHIFFFTEKGHPWNVGHFASDAEVVCWQRSNDGEEKVICCNGSYVEIEGRRVLNCTKRVSRCELVSGGSRHEVYASEPECLQDKAESCHPQQVSSD